MNERAKLGWARTTNPAYQSSGREKGPRVKKPGLYNRLDTGVQEGRGKEMGKLIAATDKNPPPTVRERPLAASTRGCAGDISTILADWLKMGRGLTLSPYL